jgi:hypothetical protein
MLFRCDRADFLDVDLASDHLMAEPGDNLSEQFQPVASLIGDQDAKMANSILGHRPIVRTGGQRDRSDFNAHAREPASTVSSTSCRR